MISLFKVFIFPSILPPFGQNRPGQPQHSHQSNIILHYLILYYHYIYKAIFFTDNSVFLVALDETLRFFHLPSIGV
jgi:hypothetical protein